MLRDRDEKDEKAAGIRMSHVLESSCPKCLRKSCEVRIEVWDVNTVGRQVPILYAQWPG